MFRIFLAVLGAVLILFPAEAAGYSQKQCFVDGFETPARCISLRVPLDYARPDGEKVTISAVVVSASTAKPAGAPLLVLAGGPGQAATGMGPWLNSAFKPARRTRDIVLFDIRGTGLSGALSCDFSLTATADAVAQIKRDALECARKVGAKGAFFSSREIVEDIERFRRAMGYSRINLWGGSFGTRLAQHYLRAYGPHVGAVVLDASTPVTESIFIGAPVDGDRALQRLFDACSADTACRTAFPALRANFDDLLSRADKSQLAVREADARSGLVEQMVLDRDGVAGLVRGALYAGFTRALVPFAISEGAKGNLKPLMALGAATSEWSVETMALGSMLSIICAEDLVRAKKTEPSRLSFGFMRDSYFRYFSAACSVWPHQALPAPMFEAISTAVPAMVISGENDPVTPPSSGEETLRQFSRGVHVVIPGGFHTNSSSVCVAGLIAEFLNDSRAGGRDHGCLKRSPKPRFLTTPNI